MSFLLSLCFPTYNRSALLDQALRAALTQITPAMHAQVEVVLLDNASPDDTPAVIQKAHADFPHVSLRHIRRPVNIGPDANFCDAPNQARGQFVYLLSDDDVLLPGAVETLLGLIQKHPQLDAFALNVREFRHSVDEQEDQGFFRMGGDRLLHTREEALILLHTHITFLSCFAFRRENVQGRDYTARFATNLAQAYMFLDALAPGHGMYAVQQPYLAKRADNNEGFDFFKVFVTHFYDLMCYAQEIGYAPEAVQESLQFHLGFLRYCTLLFKSQGTIGTIRPNYRDGLARLQRVYRPSRSLLMLVLMMLTPPALFRALHRSYRRIKAVVKPGALPPVTSSAHNSSAQKV